MNLDIRSIYKCARCGTCRSVCPVFEVTGWESYNTRGRILLLSRLLEGCSADDDTIKSLNSCTTCGICATSCPAGVDPLRVIEGARRELASSGHVTAGQARLKERVIGTGNCFGEVSDRLGWLQGDRVPVEKSDYVYFVGCLGSYRYRETVAATFGILEKFGVALLPEEQCCGSPLFRTGRCGEALVDANLEQIEGMGAQTVITGCAGCYNTLKNDYPGDFEVLSVPEFLAEHLSELNLKPLDLTVTYHDPCHLGRHNRVFDEPRRILGEICDLVEMEANRDGSRCCGGGGGVRSGYGELSLKLAKRRLEDVPGGVDCIVTSCPLCVRNLRDAGGNVIDLVDLVSRSMDKSETSP